MIDCVSAHTRTSFVRVCKSKLLSKESKFVHFGAPTHISRDHSFQHHSEGTNVVVAVVVCRHASSSFLVPDSYISHAISPPLPSLCSRRSIHEAYKERDTFQSFHAIHYFSLSQRRGHYRQEIVPPRDAE